MVCTKVTQSGKCRDQSQSFRETKQYKTTLGHWSTSEMCTQSHESVCLKLDLNLFEKKKTQNIQSDISSQKDIKSTDKLYITL